MILRDCVIVEQTTAWTDGSGHIVAVAIARDVETVIMQIRGYRCLILKTASPSFKMYPNVVPSWQNLRVP